MMVEYGEYFWRDGWGSLYSVFGGNPLAAMPSLHFATSVMAASLLAETGSVAGVLGYAYAVTLGFALVYLGEHYLVDLLGGRRADGAVEGSPHVRRSRCGVRRRGLAAGGDRTRGGLRECGESRRSASGSRGARARAAILGGGGAAPEAGPSLR